MDLFKGTFIGKPPICHWKIDGSRFQFSLNQSIERWLIDPQT